MGMALAPLSAGSARCSLASNQGYEGCRGIARSTPNGHAAESGIQAGDVIVRVGNDAGQHPEPGGASKIHDAREGQKGRRAVAGHAAMAPSIIWRWSLRTADPDERISRRHGGAGRWRRPAGAFTKANENTCWSRITSRLRSSSKRGWQENGHTVDHADNGRDGLFLASGEQYDAIILDRMLPGGIDGIGIIEALRKTGNDTPILILSALSEVDERIRGLQAPAVTITSPSPSPSASLPPASRR